MEKRHSIVAILALLLALAFAFSACNKSADQIETEKSEKVFSEAQREIGMPNIVNWQQKKTLKNIYELADQSHLICYAYMQSEYDGKLRFIGKCLGYGIPFSAQYTNPEKWTKYSWGHEKTPQADPNGLFMPTSSQATWVILIDPVRSEAGVAYVEPLLTITAQPQVFNVANLDEQMAYLNGAMDFTKYKVIKKGDTNVQN